MENLGPERKRRRTINPAPSEQGEGQVPQGQVPQGRELAQGQVPQGRQVPQGQVPQGEAPQDSSGRPKPKPNKNKNVNESAKVEKECKDLASAIDGWRNKHKKVKDVVDRQPSVFFFASGYVKMWYISPTLTTSCFIKMKLILIDSDRKWTCPSISQLHLFRPGETKLGEASR